LAAELDRANRIRFASAEKRNQFTEDLTRTIALLTTKYHDEKADAGRLFKFILGSYPAITKAETNENA
jgi:hypothetical protein